ncbi:Asp23/Gls24 family envelope stress response protein [Chloroflexota bacterium]
MNKSKSAGKTTLTPNVILTIARMAALQVDGVLEMAPVKPGIPKMKSKSKDGVSLVLEDEIAFIELYLVIDGNFNIRDISRIVQQQVARSISEMTGLEIGMINVHIEDVQYENIID